MALKVLSALDTARTQYYHFQAIIIAGMGMFTDAYDLFCIAPIMRLIGRVYYQDVKEEKDRYNVPSEIVSAMVGIALLGAVIGNLLFGLLGDRKGRKRMYGIALLLMVLSSFGCGFSVWSSRQSVLVSLAFFRFLLGIGIGGDYPLSATIMSEYANKRTRGSFIAAVFSMQGFGILTGSLVTMVMCAIFNQASQPTNTVTTPHEADLVWRIILMVGVIPAGLTLYWRLKMPETARYTALVERNVIQAAKDMEKVLDVSLSQIVEDEDTPKPNPPSYPLLSKEFLRRHGRDLFSCSTSWFLVDVVFYSSTLFQHLVCNNHRTPKKELNAYEEAFQVAKLQAIIAICSTIPGYFFTVYFIDRIGRVKIQIMGFFFMAMGFLAIGIPYSYWDSKPKIGFMFLYGLTFFFSNFGPNTTSFIVPAELFPARFRTTCYGIAAAAGKVGAIFGSIGFLWASPSDAVGMTASLVILSGVCILGMLTTYLFTTETKWRSLEDNENEDETIGLCFVRGFRTSCIWPRVYVNEVVAV